MAHSHREATLTWSTLLGDCKAATACVESRSGADRAQSKVWVSSRHFMGVRPSFGGIAL